MQAVPVAEPDWSGAHRGLCLYVSRLLQPFLAQTPVAPPKPGDSNLTCQLSPESLQVWCPVRLLPCLSSCVLCSRPVSPGLVLAMLRRGFSACSVALYSQSAPGILRTSRGEVREARQ